MKQSILEMIGLTEGEAKTYKALLRLGSSSTGAISSEAGVSTSKLYIILDKLERKGLASHIDRGGVRHFQAVEPAKIRDYLNEKRREVEVLESELEAQLPNLMALYAHASTQESITVFKGMKGLKTAHEHTYLKLGRGDEYCVLGIPQITEWDRLGYWEKDHQRRDAAGIRCRLLFNQGVEGKILMERNSYRFSEARYMPTDIKTPAYFTIYKDTTLVIIPSADPISIEIVSKEVADAFRGYFNEFWKLSKPFR
ncbi:MAG: helix-turn-helix domain-containing protein [Candidatus Micrarchaeia archaeon]